MYHEHFDSLAQRSWHSSSVAISVKISIKNSSSKLQATLSEHVQDFGPETQSAHSSEVSSPMVGKSSHSLLPKAADPLCQVKAMHSELWRQSD